MKIKEAALQSLQGNFVQPRGCPFPHETVEKKHIPPLRGDVSQNGYSPDRYPIPHQTDMEEMEARYIEQRVALEAEFTPRILDRALREGKNYPPYGLLTPIRTYGEQTFIVRHNPLRSLPLQNPYEVLEDSMNYTLKVALVEEINHLSTSTSPLDTHAQSILHGVQEHIQAGNIAVDTVLDMFLRGINTGTEKSAKILEAIEPVYKLQHTDEKPTPETLSAIATNTLPLLIEMAMYPADKLTIARRILGGSGDRRIWTPFYPDRFTIKSEQYGERLDLTEATRKQIEKEYEVLKIKKKHNSGCPAAYSGSIRDLWEWHVAIGREIYAQRIPQQLVFQKLVA